MSIVISDHALKRYQERVKPTLGRDAASADLARLVASAGEIVDELDWSPDELHPDTRYLVLAPGIALAVVDGHALTCLTNAGFSDQTRKAINLGNRRRRAAQRTKRRNTTPQAYERRRGSG